MMKKIIYSVRWI